MLFRGIHIPAFAALLFLLMSGEAVSQPTQTQKSHYSIQNWGIKEGLPQVSVKSVIQSLDGYIWVGTFGGIARFDGVRFNNAPPEIPTIILNSRITLLRKDHRGSFWAMTEGLQLAHVESTRTSYFSQKDGLPSDFSNDLCIDRNGNAWIGTGGSGLISIRSGSMSRYRHPTKGYDYGVFSILEDGAGRILVAGLNALFVAEGDSLRQLLSFPAWLRSPTTMTLDSRRRVWCGTSGGQIGMIGEHEVKLVRTLITPTGPPAITMLKEDSRQRMLAATSHGMFIFSDRGEELINKERGLLDDEVISIEEDIEGNIWLGSNTGGLCRLRDAAFRIYRNSTEGESRSFASITQRRDGSILCTPVLGKVKLVTETGLRDHPVNDRLPPLTTWSILEDRTGVLWFGTWGQGVARWNGRTAELFNSAQGQLRSDIVLALFEDSRGRIWCGTTYGGITIIAHDSVKTLTSREGLIHDDVRAFLEDRRGRIWIGTTGGLQRWADGRFQSVRMPDGFSDVPIRAFYEDADGIVWAGSYGAGLFRFQGDSVVRITTREGLFDNVVSQITEDHLGFLWMGSNRGIARMSRKELNAVAVGTLKRATAISYGTEDGMDSEETNGGFQPNALHDRSGRLWFPTTQGVVFTDPATHRYISTAPAVRIEEVVVDGHSRNMRTPLNITWENHSLAMRYTAFSYASPEKIRFRYQLVGFDEEWIEAGTRREAFYTNLKPGSYAFRVIACSSYGVWTETGAEIRFVVHPPFFESWWFIALGILMFAVGGPLVYYFHVMDLKKANQRQNLFAKKLIEQQEDERRRIASALHDSTGQDLIVMKNRIQLALHHLANPVRAESELQDALASISDALKSIRNMAHTLHPFQLERLGFSEAIKAMVHRLEDSSSIRFELEIAPVDGTLSKDAEAYAFRIIQEGVNNVAKHSGATNASVAVHLEEGHFVIRIHDNGGGIALPADTPGKELMYGFGLSGIAERVKLLGGQHKLTSQPGQGTLLVVSFPVEKNGHE